MLRDRIDPDREDTDIIFILIDLDRFKSINDTYGHDAGDRILRQVADTLRRVCRRSDFVVRWGGEEFLVVARFTDRKRTFDASERIRLSVEETPFDLGEERELRITCSIGVACFPFIGTFTGEMTWEQVLAVADQGLLAAKASGRNATVLVSATSTTEVAHLMPRLTSDFDALVRDGHLTIETSHPSSASR